MNRINCLFRFAPLAFLMVGACETYQPGQGPLSDFEFLQGTWVQINSKEITEETWTSNQGWSMRGVGRTLRDGKEVFGEQLTIEPRGAKFVYVARLAGQDEVEFALVARGPNWVRFENPTHDFPQRIEYHREGKRLRAEISGREKGALQSEVTEYQRASGH